MDKNDWLAKSFQENRSHMKAVAYRMLGNEGEAEEAVQETWLRLAKVDAGGIDNLGGWLTTVVARICLDILRARKSRPEAPPEPASIPEPDADLLLADSVGPALLVVLETLTPTERVAFVLHDLFDLSFEEIAPIVDRTAEAARQLASRARRKVRGAPEPAALDHDSQKRVVTAFLAASRDGDFAALLALMDPNVVLRADDVAVQAALKNKAKGAPPFGPELRGAHTVADTFKGRAKAAQVALIDGLPGATFAPGGKPLVVFLFTLQNGKIGGIDVVMDPEKLRQLDIRLFNQQETP